MRNLIIAAIAVLLITACKGGEGGGGKPGGGAAVYNVRGWKAERSDFNRTVTAVGTLEPEEEVLLSAQVQAELTRIVRDEGSAAKAGDLLAVLDEKKFRLKRDKAEADAKKAEADLDYAIKDFTRKEALLKDGVIAARDYDEAISRKDAAKAALASAAAALAIAAKELEDSRIKAPFAGVVSERFVSEGTYLKEGDKIFKFINASSIKASAMVPEAYRRDVKIGQTAVIKTASGGPEYSGSIYFINPKIDEKDRTFEVKARIPNKDGVFTPGGFADMKIITGVDKGVFLVPEKGVIIGKGGRAIVFLAKDGAVSEAVLTVGDRSEGKIVVREGISDGDIVVVEGAQSLRAGAKINMTEVVNAPKPVENKEVKKEGTGAEAAKKEAVKPVKSEDKKEEAKKQASPAAK